MGSVGSGWRRRAYAMPALRWSRAAVLAVVAVGAGGGAAVAQQAAPPAGAGVGQPVLPRFEDVDVDGDGRLTRPEWEIFDAPFDTFDRDGSGGIDPAEYEVYLDQKRSTIESVAPPPELPYELQALEEEAEHEFKAGNFQKATAMYARLAERAEHIPEFRYRLAECYFETGKLEQAREIYEKVLAAEPDNIVALLAMARVESRTAGGERDVARKDQILQRVRGRLVHAARLGANVLWAIDNYQELKLFRDDIKLQIDIVKAPAEVTLGEVVRDPFRNPLPRKTAPGAVATGPGEPASTPADAFTLQRQRELVQRLNALVDRLKEHIANEDFEAIATVWLEIEDLIRHESSIRDLEVAGLFEKLKEEAQRQKPVVRSLLLRGLFAQGERMLAEMQEAVAQQRFSRVFDLWERLRQHAERMVQTDPSFAQAAEDLKARGRMIEHNARVLEEIGRFAIGVTATVVGGGVAKAIVNNRIVGEGDIVYDTRGNPIGDLRVVTIKRGKVRFSYKGLEFERDLKEG